MAHHVRCVGIGTVVNCTHSGKRKGVTVTRVECDKSERSAGRAFYGCTLVRLIKFGSFGLTAEPLADCTNLPAFDQISLFNDCSLCKLGRSTEETTVARARVLLVGLDADIVDYTKSPVPGLTAARVRAAVETDSAHFEKLINIVHRHAPASMKICFNSNPADTAEAVKRWV